MARTRTYRPEFWDDQKLAEKTSRDARLTFLGILTNSDDYGVVKGHLAWLCSQIYPYETIKPLDFKKWILELEIVGVIIPFSKNGESYYYIRSFKTYQKVDHPSKYKNPDPPEDILERLAKPSRDSLDETEFGLSKTEDNINTVVPEKTGPTDHKIFVEFFCQEYQTRFNVKYDFNGGRDGKLVQGLLKSFGLELLKKMTAEFFLTTDPFIKEKIGFTIPGLKMRANQIAASLSKNKTFYDSLSAAGQQTLKNAAAWLAKSEGQNDGKR